MHNPTTNLLIRDLLVAVAKSATFSTTWLDTSKGEANGFLIAFGLNTGTAAAAGHKIVTTMEESATTTTVSATAVAAA